MFEKIILWRKWKKNAEKCRIFTLFDLFKEDM